MGKQRFRLSHMIPNAWFYRLRDMNTKKRLPSAYSSTTKNSFCYTPRYYTSPTPTSNTNTINNPALSSYTPPVDELTQDLFLSPNTILSSYYESPFSESTRSCSCGALNSSTTEVVIELNEKSYTKRIQDSSGYYDLVQEIELQKPPPILTKSKNKDTLTMVEKKEETSSTQSSISIKIVKESISKKERKPVSGVKIRSNSSRTAVCKRNIIEANNDHKRQKNSCCIVKSSIDPQKDFKESMMEMIVEDNIKDFENLLASYLSLNSNEYHDMIIKAFEEIWLTFEFVE